MMKLWNLIEKCIDFLASVMEKIGWVLILYCMAFGAGDVFLRYVMGDPTTWIITSVKMCMVLMACVGGMYSLNEDAFVRLDLFYANFSKRKKALCDVITSVFTFAFLIALIYKGYGTAMMSLKFNQMTPTSIPFPIYPVKIFIVVTGVLVMLVVIKKLVNDLITLSQEFLTNKEVHLEPGQKIGAKHDAGRPVN